MNLNHQSTLFKSAICLMLGIMLSAINVFGQMPAHYPTVELTGDAAIDDANWIKAKNEWIKNYPGEYQSMGGKVDAVSNGADTQVAEATPEKSYLNIDFNSPNLYKIVDMDAVDVFGVYTPVQLEQYKKEAKQSLEKVALSIDMEKGMYYIKSKINEGNEREYHFTIVDENLVLEGCKECIDSVFKIIFHDEKTLTIQLKPQDADQNFMFHITLKK